MKQKIELSHKKYWIQCTFNEAKFYCFALNIDGKIGWRLPTHDEASNSVCRATKDLYIWYAKDFLESDIFKEHLFWCTPIRDLI